MKNFLNKKIPLFVSSLTLGISPFAMTSCGSANSIQLANFESYMDGDLMDYIGDKYDVHYQWYTVAEMIQTKFEKVYDIAIPSAYELITLYRKGWLDKIDWGKFDIHDPITGDLINTNNEVMELIAQPVREAIIKMNEMFRQYLIECGDEHGNEFDILDYGVPYFAQSFMFVYKGTPLQFYKTGTTEKTDKPTWADIIYTISPANPSLDPRFNQSVTGRTGMLDDAKTLYDISRICETTINGTNPFLATNQMPLNSNVSDLVHTFNYLADNFKNKTGTWFALNTDSGIISRNLADHKHGYAGAVTWSGDALYSALGAEEFVPYSSNEMRIQRPYGVSLDEIEFVVINNKNSNNQNKLDRIYKIIFDICLDGVLAQPTQDDIGAQEDGRFKYWSMQNWNTVMYTPIWKSIYEYVVDNNSPYWDYAFEGRTITEEEKKASKELYISIVQYADQNYAHSLFGRPLTPLQNSNNHWAWLQTRGKL